MVNHDRNNPKENQETDESREDLYDPNKQKPIIDKNNVGTSVILR